MRLCADGLHTDEHIPIEVIELYIDTRRRYLRELAVLTFQNTVTRIPPNY